jgi:hypothetical protein
MMKQITCYHHGAESDSTSAYQEKHRLLWNPEIH